MKTKDLIMVFALLFLVSLFNNPVWAYDVNKDLKNIGGSSAHDLAVILAGSETVTNHYDGYPIGTGNGKEGTFGSFSHGPQVPNTKMHWQNFWDGTNNTIDPGQTIHVGWSTQDRSSNVLDMYWTNASGGRIPGSKICNITSGWTYETSTHLFTAVWDNIFSPEGSPGGAITIEDVQWAMFDTRIPLDELNTENSVLAAALQPLPGGGSFQVSWGASVSLDIPVPVPQNYWVTLRYSTSCPDSAAETLDFVQMVPEPATFLFLGLGGLVMLKKRRQGS